MHICLVIFSCVVVAAFAQLSGGGTCANSGTISIAFKSRSEPGSPSYVTSEASNDLYYMNPTNVIAPIVIHVSRVASLLGAPTLFLDSKGLLVTASCPSLVFSGSIAPVREGKAVFTTLKPSSSTVSGGALGCVPQTSYTITFTLVSSLGIPVAVPQNSVSATFQCATSSSRIRFDLASYGFLTPATQQQPIPLNAVLPKVYLTALDDFGFPTVPLTVPSLKVVLPSAGVTVTPQSVSPCTLTGCTITGLTFTAPSSTTVTIINFNISSSSAPPTKISLNVLQGSFPNAIMGFDPTSFIPEQGAKLTTVAEVPAPPIRIFFYDSKFNFDQSSTGAVVVASSKEGTLTGNVAIVSQGVATFDSLAFDSSSAPRSAAVITFSSPGMQSLFTGNVSVTTSPILATTLAFSSRSAIQSGVSLTVAVDSTNAFSLPTITVLMLNSAFQLDSTADGATLQLQLQGSSAVLSSGSTATVSNGIAAFSNIRCTNGAEGSQLVVCVNDPTGIRPQLCSGPITLAAVSSNPTAELNLGCANSIVACKYYARFGDPPLSFVFAAGQPLFATVGVLIPEIRISLFDMFGPIAYTLSSTAVPVMIASTGTSAQYETNLYAEGRVGIWRKTYWSFSCLRFRKVPSGLVTISFAAVSSLETFSPFVGIPRLETGYVRVAPLPTSGYDLRFSSSNQVFSFAGQPSTAVLSVPLPPITIEVLTSDYQVDTSVSNVMIVASVTSGSLQIEGKAEVVQNGVAVFRFLTFDSVGLEPKLSFTAQRTTLPINGRAVTTGNIVVTGLPIPASEISFSSLLSSVNNVTAPFSFFNFASFDTASLVISVVIRNSAHVLVETVEKTVVIAQVCAEAALAATQTVTIAQGAASFATFQAQLLSFQADYVGQPIFVRYKVTGGSSPWLIGQQLVVGPIFIADYFDPSACDTHYYSPPVSVLFRSPLSQFNLTSALASVATQLNLDQSVAVTTVAAMPTFVVAPSKLSAFSRSSRILPLMVEAVAAMDKVSLARWTGTKVVLQFQSPLTSTMTADTRTPVTLATSLVQARPTCSATSLSPFTTTGDYTIQSASFYIDDATCDADQFIQSVYTAGNCSLAGLMTTCQCYSVYSMTPYGGSCSLSPGLVPLFTSLCSNELSLCGEASVAMACQSFAPAQATSVVAYLALIALVAIPIAIGAYCCLKRRESKNVFLNTEKQVAIDHAQRPLGERVKELLAAVKGVF